MTRPIDQYICAACHELLFEPFFCRDGVQRFAIAMYFVAVAIDGGPFYREMMTSV